MKARLRKIKGIGDVVSTLNNYLETHAYLFEGEFYGDAADIVSNYGFGYVDGDERILHWIEGGDFEACSLMQSEVVTMINKGLTDESFTYIMEKCK